MKSLLFSLVLLIFSSAFASDAAPSCRVVLQDSALSDLARLRSQVVSAETDGDVALAAVLKKMYVAKLQEAKQLGLSLVALPQHLATDAKAHHVARETEHAREVKIEENEHHLKDWQVMAEMQFNANGLEGLSTSPDGKFLISEYINQFKLSDVLTGVDRNEITILSNFAPKEVLYSPDQSTIAVSTTQGKVRFLDAHTLAFKPGTISSVKTIEMTNGLAFNPTGQKLAIAEGGGSSKVWISNLVKDKSPKVLDVKSHGNRIRYIGDHHLLVSSSMGREVSVWDVKSGKRILRQDDGAYAKFSQQTDTAANWLVVAKLGGGINVWDLSKPEPTSKSSFKNTIFRSAVISPDGTKVASVLKDVPHDILLWDRTTAKEIARLDGFGGGWSPEFSPDGRFIVKRTETSVPIWSATTGVQLATLEHEDQKPRDFTFSTDGKSVWVAFDDGVAQRFQLPAAP